MTDEERTKEIREVRRMLLDVAIAAQRQVGELEQLKQLIAQLDVLSEHIEPVKRRGEGLADDGTL